MKKCFALIAAMVLIASPVWAAPEDWKLFNLKRYGVSMKAPEQMAFAWKELPDGWGEMHGSIGEAYFKIICRLDVQATAEQIEAYAEKEFGVSPQSWELADQGQDRNGWKWFKTLIVRRNDSVYMAKYGTGDMGSYLIYLTTFQSELDRYRAQYFQWYESIRLKQK